MAIDHPFQNLFESLDHENHVHAPSVNRRAAGQILEALDAPAGRPGHCILLKAPRAGYGKTHLLLHARHAYATSHEFITLHAASAGCINAESSTDDVLRRLSRPLPAGGGLTVLDLVARRLFARALEPLVTSGEVPCQDRDGALTALRNRPVETFDFHHPNAVTAHWAKENFSVLGQRLGQEIARRLELPAREVAQWVDILFQYATAAPDNPERLRKLAGLAAGDAATLTRLATLLGMLSSLMRVVLVADELEGYSADESAALRLAAFIAALRQAVPALDVVVSVNEDVWQSAFVPRLSGGLADRLSETQIDLQPLSREDMLELLESRAPGLGHQVLDHLPNDESMVHARGLLRAAGQAWVNARRDRMKNAAPARHQPPAPSPTPQAPPAAPPSLPPTARPSPPPTAQPSPPPTARSVEPPPVRLDPESHAMPGPQGRGQSPFPATPPAPAEPAPATTDRVDDLLQQFRQRYGKPGL